jgi:calcium-dependent protein kinase
MKKLFLAINHCHSNGVVHRDLKPENIMYKEETPGQQSARGGLSTSSLSEVKIIDFGLGKIVAANPFGQMKTLVGTPYYVAPEVLEGKYGCECDCWSLGVIMYALLSGCLPFYGSTSAEVYERIKQAKISFNFKEFLGISESAKDLISRLLTKDTAERFSCT